MSNSQTDQTAQNIWAPQNHQPQPVQPVWPNQSGQHTYDYQPRGSYTIGDYYDPKRHANLDLDNFFTTPNYKDLQCVDGWLIDIDGADSSPYYPETHRYINTIPDITLDIIGTTSSRSYPLSLSFPPELAAAATKDGLHGLPDPEPGKIYIVSVPTLCYLLIHKDEPGARPIDDLVQPYFKCEHDETQGQAGHASYTYLVAARVFDIRYRDRILGPTYYEAGRGVVEPGLDDIA